MRILLFLALIVLILPYSGIFGTGSGENEEPLISDEVLPLPQDFDAVLERGDMDGEVEIIDELEEDGTN